MVAAILIVNVCLVKTPKGNTATTQPFPVILISGLAADETSWAAFVAYLTVRTTWKDGGVVRAGGTVNSTGEVFRVHLSDNLAPFLTQARELAEIVEAVKAAKGASKVILVGWSMGGLVARWYLQFIDTSDSVAALVTIGTPHQGVPQDLTEAGKDFIFCPKADNPDECHTTLDDLATGSLALQFLNAAVSVIRLGSSHRATSYMSLIGLDASNSSNLLVPRPSDGIVSEASQNLQSVLDDLVSRGQPVSGVVTAAVVVYVQGNCDVPSSDLIPSGRYEVHTCEPGDPGVQEAILQSIMAVGGRSLSSGALSLVGESAQGGGVFAGYTLGDMNNAGDLVFEAGIDLGHTSPGPCNPITPANCIPGDYRMFRRSGDQTSLISVPGIDRIGTVRINNSGDMAFGAAPSGTGPLDFAASGIYLLRRGQTTPIQIAAFGGPTRLGGTYYQIYGPLALSEQGDVVFQSNILNAGNGGNYIWLYRAAPGVVTKLVAYNDSTPIGGTFTTNLGFAIAFTDDGDVVFPAEVTGGTSGGGVFIAPRNAPIRKVVVASDSAPAPVRGRLGIPRPVVGRPVAGRKLVFIADSISGGATTEAIISKDDVTVDTASDLRVVAMKGQPTGTDVCGMFQSLSNGAGNPQVRRDGAVLFDAVVAGASLPCGGAALPTDFGIFLWTGREMKRIAVTGEHLATGGTVNVGTSHTLNDIGHVRYGAVGIH